MAARPELETRFFITVDADFHYEQGGNASATMIPTLGNAQADLGLPLPSKNDLHWVVILHQCQINSYGERSNVHTVCSMRIRAADPASAVAAFSHQVLGL